MRNLSPAEKIVATYRKKFNLNLMGSPSKNFRIKFCDAAVNTLEEFCQKSNPKNEDAIAIKKKLLSLAASLKMCSTNTEFVKIMSEIKLDDFKASAIPYSVVKHIRFMYGDESPKDIQNIANYIPKTSDELKYEALSKSRETLAKSGVLAPGDFIVTTTTKAGDDFIHFNAMGVEFNPNNTKLRLSIARAQFANAWDLIKDELLAMNSPIIAFKIIDLKQSDLTFEKYKKELEVYAHESKLSQDETKILFTKEEEKNRRLTEGGQITLYLPLKMKEADVSKVAQFLNRIISILQAKNIEAGVTPFSDTGLATYVSGRAAGDGFFSYARPEDTAGMSAEDDPVLHAFAKALNPEMQKKLADKKQAVDTAVVAKQLPAVGVFSSEKGAPEKTSPAPEVAPTPATLSVDETPRTGPAPNKS